MHTLAERIGRFLERQGLLERDAENSYLSEDALNVDPMNILLGHALTSATAPASMQSYRIAVVPHIGRKMFTLPTSDEPCTGSVAGFSLHAGVVTKANERDKLERLCQLHYQTDTEQQVPDTGNTREAGQRQKNQFPGRCV